MTSYLKALGLALMACLALGAVAASGASAQIDGQEDHFKVTGSQNEKAVITAEDTVIDEKGGIFGVHGSAAEVTCKHSTYAGTVQNGATELSVVPTYTDCKAAGQEATVTVDECAYTLYGETTEHPKHASTGTGSDEVHAPVKVHCETGGGITIEAPACKIHILAHEQGKLHGVTYDNVADHSEGKDAVEVTATVDGIKYTAEGFVCELLEIPEEGEEGFLTADIIATGYEDKDSEPGTFQDVFDHSETPLDITVESTPLE